ncbi:MAG: AraC family transcriptional regulator [Coleofasciculus sp. S288]|nr:AraC family transcriptional regulator [Coleofasciculus sp. S288]
MKEILADKPLALNYFQEDATSQLLPNPPLLTSHQSGWRDIQLAYHRQPSWELPELDGSQHIIAVPIAPHPVGIEFVSEGRLQHIQYHPIDYANGCIEIFPAKLPYKLCWNQQVEFIHCYLEPTFLSGVAHETVDPTRVELVLELRKIDLLIYSICLALKTALEVNGAGSCIYAESLATALSVHLLRYYSTRKHNLREHESGLPKQKLKQAVDYINEHLSEDLSLTEIAAELRMSQYYFCRLFKQSTGMSPHKYLIQQRIEQAKQLLKQKELTVTDVALTCGFANQSHFAKYFRLYTGVTPNQFRKT